MDTAKKKRREIIRDARKLTLCVDGTDSSIHGVSACFYHLPRGKVHHALLHLHLMEQPHSGEAVACCIHQTWAGWDTGEDEALLVVTDNAANIVKAVRLVRDKGQHEDHVPQAQAGGSGDQQDELWRDSHSGEESDAEGEESGGFGECAFIDTYFISLNNFFKYILNNIVSFILIFACDSPQQPC